MAEPGNKPSIIWLEKAQYESILNTIPIPFVSVALSSMITIIPVPNLLWANLFLCMSLFQPYNYLVRWVILSPFWRWETKAQRNQTICSDHSVNTWLERRHKSFIITIDILFTTSPSFVFCSYIAALIQLKPMF